MLQLVAVSGARVGVRPVRRKITEVPSAALVCATGKPVATVTSTALITEFTPGFTCSTVGARKDVPQLARILRSSLTSHTKPIRGLVVSPKSEYSSRRAD